MVNEHSVKMLVKSFYILYSWCKYRPDVWHMFQQLYFRGLRGISKPYNNLNGQYQGFEYETQQPMISTRQFEG